jgi:hypothetical protein
MASVDTDVVRTEVEQVLTSLTENGDGEVWDEDVRGVLTILGLDPHLFYKRVEALLEEIMYNRRVADALYNDGRWAVDYYFDGNYPGVSGVELLRESCLIEAERSFNSLIGLVVFA